MDALGHTQFPIYGTDTGMPIAYAVAADHRDRVQRLIVSEAFLPGLGNPIPLFLPPLLNARLWHLMFNQLPPEVNEAMIRGREEIFFGAEFDAAAGATKLPAYAVDYYIRMLQDERDDLRGSFGFYRAIGDTANQDIERQKNPLTIPVLAMGGNESTGTGPGGTMQLVASDVLTKVVPAGHWVAEQAPAEIISELESFLSPLHAKG
jgi:pimeloyl-ACP methyl ester carboxylesterase